mgnify:CR=1 FL=1
MSDDGHEPVLNEVLSLNAQELAFNPFPEAYGPSSMKS